MADLKSLNELLSAAAHILDSAAGDIRDIPLDPTQHNIGVIGKALTLIFEIQQQIYKIDPKMEPEYLKRHSPYPKELNIKFGEIVINAADLCTAGKYQEAISLYKEFINEKPPEFFINIAQNCIVKIKKDHGV
ncbi:MAG: hypothetical protein JXB17_07700 [Bacteroidales bacterium]|nr:hypothetical protein [Bacteroidales bacterium]